MILLTSLVILLSSAVVVSTLCWFKCQGQIWKQRTQIKQLEHLAYYDLLTETANRLKFNQEAPKMLEQARSQHRRVAFILIDVDGFKQINDNYGHQAGDYFLKKLASKLQDIVHDYVNTSLLARLGGDEFVLFLYGVEDARHIIEIVNEIYETLSVPLAVEEFDIPAHLSMGISLFPYDGLTVSGLLKAADLALYTAKENGKNTFCFHEKKMSTRFERAYEHQQTIKYFIETDDFTLKYQPIVDTKTSKLKGVEVLFGGNDVKYPDLKVEEMITIAEESDNIVELGTMILRRACFDYVERFPVEMKQGKFFISVNVSAKQLDDEKFVEKVVAIIKETKIEPQVLSLEITETAIIKNYKDVIAKMDELKKLGVGFCIDDFGKGYSSMSYLRKLAVNKLKIDKSFIDDISDKKSAEIVKTILAMAKTLGLQCVAEGVETVEQLEFLKLSKCDCVQGYLISKGLPIEQLPTLLG